VTTITIHGKPFAKQRPRATRTGRMYTPAETVRFETVVRQAGLEQFTAPLTGPVSVTIFATFEAPESWSKKKRVEHLHRPHTQKPDLDNIEKAILDGLNRVAFVDDAQVAEVTKRKVWGVNAQTIVIIKPMGEA
jgi:Holliday junction resolvase RusA-like endonuclease